MTRDVLSNPITYEKLKPCVIDWKKYTLAKLAVFRMIKSSLMIKNWSEYSLKLWHPLKICQVSNKNI